MHAVDGSTPPVCHHFSCYLHPGRGECHTCSSGWRAHTSSSVIVRWYLMTDETHSSPLNPERRRQICYACLYDRTLAEMSPPRYSVAGHLFHIQQPQQHSNVTTPPLSFSPAPSQPRSHIHTRTSTTRTTISTCSRPSFLPRELISSTAAQ